VSDLRATHFGVVFGGFYVLLKLWNPDAQPALVIGMDITGSVDSMIIGQERCEAQLVARQQQELAVRHWAIASRGKVTRSRRLLPLMLLACACVYASERPTVIELYTSEGCSSCPPAEALLGHIANRDNVIALALHVDYWDSAGWTDKYALRAATQRQSQYAHNLRRASVVTPQFVIDGARAVEGTNRLEIMAAARAAPQGIAVDLAIDAGQLRIALGAAVGATPCDVMLFAYLPRTVSNVARGENAGRTLEEFNVVRAVLRIDNWNGQAKSLGVPLAQLPPDATQLAVIVQQVGLGQIVGAAHIVLR
jgi:hypothetical protein